MKTISFEVSDRDYEAFQQSASEQGLSVAQLIREAMAFYRSERLQRRERLFDLPVLPGHQAVGNLPSRVEVYDEMFGAETSKED